MEIGNARSEEYFSNVQSPIRFTLPVITYLLWLMEQSTKQQFDGFETQSTYLAQKVTQEELIPTLVCHCQNRHKHSKLHMEGN